MNEVCYRVQDKDVCWCVLKAVIIFREFLSISDTIGISRRALLFWS